MRITLSIIFLCIFFGISFENANAQSETFFKYRAKYLSYKEYKEISGWEEWSDWAETNTLITIDLVDERISVYADNQLNFDIIDYSLDENPERSVIYLECLDDDGVRCRVRYSFNDFDEDKQLYIDYDTYVFVFSLKALTTY